MINLTFIGNYYINKIPEFKNPEIEVLLKITGVSHFSMACGKKLNSYGEHATEIGEKVDALKCLRQLLSDSTNKMFGDLSKKGGRSYSSANNSDFIIVDNTACVYDLINISNEGLYTLAKHSKLTDSEFYNLSDDIQKQRLIKPYRNELFDWRFYFDYFIDTVKERFQSKKIILLRGSHVQYFLNEGKLQKYSEEDLIKISFLNMIDDYFIEKTQCEVINLLDSFCTTRYEKWHYPPAIIESECGFMLRDEIENIVFNNERKEYQGINPTLAIYEQWINAENGIKNEVFSRLVTKESKQVQDRLLDENIEILKNSGGINCPELFKQACNTQKIFIRLSQEYFLEIDYLCSVASIKRFAKDINIEKLVKNSFHCDLLDINKIIESYQVYIEKARRGYGKQPFVIDVTEETFIESLLWQDYKKIFDNEKVIFSFAQQNYCLPYDNTDIECQVNLEFLFEPDTKIVRLGDGLGDQLFLYFFGKTIESQNHSKVYFDDTVYTYRKIFNGLEISKVIGEDITKRLFTHKLSNALIDRLQNCISAKQYDYRLLYTLYYAGLKNLTFVYTPTNDKIRNQYPGNKICLEAYEPEEDFFSDLANISFGLSYFSVIYRPPRVLIKYKDFWNSLICFNKLDDDCNLDIASQIQNSDSIILHIRRGDFEKQNRIIKSEIYANSIRKVKQIKEYKNKKYFVFSDDLEWCKNHEKDLGLDSEEDDIMYVSNNAGLNSWKDMVLMSKAKIMLVANSGFSLNAFIANKDVEMIFGPYDFEKAGWVNKYQAPAGIIAIDKKKECEIKEYSEKYGESIKNRENTEWLNYWWDKAKYRISDRVLLIGDSTSRQYRGALAKMTGYPIDFFASTANICEDYYFQELELFLSVKEYRPIKVHVQIGYHGIEGVEGANITYSLSDYEGAYEKLIKKLLDITPDVTIATATHIVCKDDLSKVNEELNSQLQKKNSIAIKVAEKYHLNVNDLYKYMIEEGYMYKHTDMVHFEQSSNEFIAKRVAKAIGLD